MKYLLLIVGIAFVVVGSVSATRDIKSATKIKWDWRSFPYAALKMAGFGVILLILAFLIFSKR
jgi:hypothetical protein